MYETLPYIAFWTGVYILNRIYKKRKKLNLSPKKIMQYLDSIEDLHETAERYKAIENIIIDLNTADRQHLKNITVDVPRLFEGAGTKYGFMCSGDRTTKQFIQIAEQERARLLQELFDKTKELERRHATAATLRRYGEDQSEAGET